MNLNRIKVLLLRHALLLAFFPTLVALLVFVLIRNRPQEFTSVALLYTGFTSGYNLESPEAERPDYVSISSDFDNLLNTIRLQSTLEEVSIQLLANYLAGSKSFINTLPPKDIAFLEGTIPPAYRREVVPGKRYEELREVLFRHYKEGNPFLKRVVRADESPFGIHTLLTSLEAIRKGSSDMVEMTYKDSNPWLAQETLRLLIDTFVKRYKMAKTGEASSVVTYFENQLREAESLLKQKEDSLKLFSSSNGIINYEEDSKSIAAQRKGIESQIQQESSALAASEAVLRQLNQKLYRVKEVAARSVSINGMRDSLAVMQAQLLLNKGASRDNGLALQDRIQKLEARLRTELSALNAASNTGDGISSKLLLSGWIDAMLEVDRAKARIGSLRAMQSGKQHELQKIVPVGVELNRLKRDITLTEENYLAILRNLNASKLRAQNINTSTNLRVLDEPSLPEKPDPSKKKILVLLSFFAGLSVVMSYLLSKELLSKTIHSPGQAEERTGVPFAIALPKILREDARTAAMIRQLLVQGINKLRLQSWDAPLTIVLFSTQAGDGKTFFGDHLSSILAEAGCRTLVTSRAGNNDHLRWYANVNLSSWQAAKTPGVAAAAAHDIILLELSSVSAQILPVSLLEKAHLSLLVLPCDRAWTEADQNMLKIYQENIKHPLYAVLNKVEQQEAARLLQGVPVKAAAVVPGPRSSDAGVAGEKIAVGVDRLAAAE